MRRNQLDFNEQEALPYLLKRPDESDIFNMVWHILAPDDYIIKSSWIITSDTEKAPTLIPMSFFINNTPLYEDRQGSQYRLPWRKSTAIVLIGGTAGVNYELTNRINTNSGRVLTRTGDLRVVDRYPEIDRFDNTARFQS